MSNDPKNERVNLSILGVRGVPAAHGGFETFAARLAPHLAKAGWNVSVYCQESGQSAESPGNAVWESTWEDVKRVHIAVPSDTALNSIRFDWHCILHVLKTRPDVVLILGYNTAIFALPLRVAGIPVVMNMDGMEWQRAKWGMLEKAWLYVNERAGCRLSQHLIADHPHIGRHLQTRTRPEKISVIPYGSDLIERRLGESTVEQQTVLERIGVVSKRFATVIARAEPENSIIDIVRAFSSKPRDMRLVVLGTYYPDRVKYHADVFAAASPEVVFPGAIYDKFTVETLRRHSLFYFHGHQVGGTNPSLLEAMGAGNAVLAHDNFFNRWVAQNGALYFSDAAGCERAIEQTLADPLQCAKRGELNRSRAEDVFNWDEILQSYMELLTAVGSRAGAAETSGWGRREQWTLNAAS